MLRILFIARGTKSGQPTPIILNQGKSIEDAGQLVSYFPIKGNGYKAYIRSIFAIRKHLKTNAIDIIHAHYGLCGIIALFARRREKVVISFMVDDIIGTNKADGSILILSKAFALLNIFLARRF